MNSQNVSSKVAELYELRGQMEKLSTQLQELSAKASELDAYLYMVLPCQALLATSIPGIVVETEHAADGSHLVLFRKIFDPDEFSYEEPNEPIDPLGHVDAWETDKPQLTSYH